ncbi:LapA family protein [Brachybacterium tyrofermentans]|uniref:Lipopolysaccharide assembly LapA domain-containing protein n=1 Tax=Brachybacterium tyrofermentans TaxID=47848 RepID=A0ABW0FKG3_9MICO
MSTGPENTGHPLDREPVDRAPEAAQPAAADRAPEDPAAGRRAADPAGGVTDPVRDAPRESTGRRASQTPTERTSADRTPAERTLAEEPLEAPRSGGKTAGLWISLILGAIVLVLLLIFVIQNSQSASFEYFNATFDLPLGVAMLLAAIAGALVMALVGSVRMFQMSWTIRKMRKQQEKIQRAVR